MANYCLSPEISGLNSLVLCDYVPYPTLIKGIILLFVHIVVSIVKLLEPGVVKAIVAVSLLMKQQFLIINRYRAPRLTVSIQFDLVTIPNIPSDRTIPYSAIIVGKPIFAYLKSRR